MIAKIILDSFGKFQDAAFELRPFTVVLGRNESGKTTLFDALFDNICGNDGRGSVWKRLKERYGTRAHRKSSLEYTEGAEPYDITADDFLGVYGVRSGAIHLEADESRSWAELAKSSLFSGGLDPALVARELARRNDYSGNVAHNNEIKALHAELAHAGERLAALEAARERILSSASETGRLAALAAELGAKLELNGKEVKEAQAEIKAFEAAMERAGAQEELEFLEKYLASGEKLARLAAYKDEKLREYDALAAAAAELERQIESLKGAQKSMETQAAELATELRGREERRALAQKPADSAALLLGRIAGFNAAGGGSGTARYLAWGAGALLGLAALYVFREHQAAALIVAAVVMAGTLAAGLFLGGGKGGAEKALLSGIYDEWRNAGLDIEGIRRETLAGVQEALIQEKTALKAAAEEIQAITARRLDLDEKVKAGDAALKRLAESKETAAAKARAWLDSAGCKGRDEYHSKVVEAAECLKENAVMAARLGALLTARQADTPENLKIKLRLLADEHSARSGAVKADKKALEARRAGQEALLRARETLASDKAETEAELEGLKGQAAGGLKGLPESIQAGRAVIAAIKEKISANRLVGAASAVAAGIFSEMAGDSGLAFSALAAEIRTALEPVLPAARVEISDLSLEDVKISDAAGAMRELELVSSGTRDCFMLAARLALARKARGERPGILILDEPFYTLDAPRLAAALELLKAFQANGAWQVILFTKDTDLASAAAAAFANGPAFKLLTLG